MDNTAEYGERDYPEADDENAAGAMRAERDALRERVKDLEREKANLLRDVAYLNRKLDEARRTVRQNVIDFERLNKDGSLDLALKDTRTLLAALKRAQEANP